MLSALNYTRQLVSGELTVASVSSDAAELYSLLIQEIVDHPYHVPLEVTFCTLLLIMILPPMHKTRRGSQKKLTKKMEEEIIAEYRSAPLSTNIPADDDPSFFNIPPMASFCGPIATSAEGVKYTNLATFDYLCYATHPDVIELAQKIIIEYGCGSCGPRGFYGSLKPHIDFESDLAKFMGHEDAIVYSFSYATVSTLIPCFSARGDEILVDEACCDMVMHGCFLSRSVVKKYRHNDMEHLEELMIESKEVEAKTGKIPRRWIVTEGLFRNNGHICWLSAIMALKRKYKFRLILEDSHGFGTLGQTGRGTPEHCGLSLDSHDIYVGAMSTSLGSVGGFCTGAKELIDHQRLGAAAYVFSAALPPYATASASCVLQDLHESEGLRSRRLQENAIAFRQYFEENPLALPASIELLQQGPGANKSPLIHFVIRNVLQAHAGGVSAASASPANQLQVINALAESITPTGNRNKVSNTSGLSHNSEPQQNRSPSTSSLQRSPQAAGTANNNTNEYNEDKSLIALANLDAKELHKTARRVFDQIAKKMYEKQVLAVAAAYDEPDNKNRPSLRLALRSELSKSQMPMLAEFVAQTIREVVLA